MSSATSSFAQKSGRSKFLVAIFASENSSTNTWGSAVTLPTSVTIPKSIFTRTEFNALDADSYSFSAGALFKDLGREIVVVDDDNSLHRNVFRECMLVSGASSEGISSNEDDVRIFVKVYSSNGNYQTVVVARTG
jgi:hypothetical protein